MKPDVIRRVALLIIAIANLLGSETAAIGESPANPAERGDCLSPTALAASPDGRILYIACATANRVAVFDTTARHVTRSIWVPASPLGLALSGDGSRLYVACAAAASTVCVIHTARGEIIAQIPVGHTTMAPVLSPDGRTLYICNRFDNDISVINLDKLKETQRLRVLREPVAAAVTPDGQYLLVANHLPVGRANTEYVSASVTVIAIASGSVVRQIALPPGSGLLRDVRVAPDGRYACVTHVLAHFLHHALSAHQGWINNNAISVIDLENLTLLNTVLVDDNHSGAANPWAAAWSADGQLLCITHAGTHELSVIDAPGLLAKLAGLPRPVPSARPAYYARFDLYRRYNSGTGARSRAEVPRDLKFLAGLRHRIKLDGKGPRAVSLVGSTAYVANYFSDTLSLVDLATPGPRTISIPLGPAPALSAARQGELWFNDATLAQQGWQSCASCHDADARMDGLNWDLPNDGLGNPKNSKSLLGAHGTAPAMALGVRATAEVAVRAGITHILFSKQPEAVPAAIDEYLKSLSPLPSPYLVNGKLSAAAERGQRLFCDATVGCAGCHPPPAFTNLRSYNVGTRGDYDHPTDCFDTPALVELWRTAPYLHHGGAATLQDVLTSANPGDLHGRTSHLTHTQLADLAEYLLSL